MKKEIWILIILAIIIVALLGFFAFMPVKTKSPKLQTGIVITLPKSGEEIFTPLKITGYVNGAGWSGFEGQVGTVKLLDGSGVELATGILTATTEWTTLPTSFQTTLAFAAGNNGPGTLVFKNENPSGDPARDKTFSLPVKINAVLGQQEVIIVKPYFAKTGITGSTCSVVFPVDRAVPKTEAVARAALEELLNGPTDAEKSQGYATIIPAGSKLNSISIVNGVASADFNAVTESGGGSCSMAARVAQITETLKQFPTITSVKLSINGRTGDIFQP